MKGKPMRVKRWTALAAVTVVLAGLSGCGGGTETVADETPATSSGSSQPVESDDEESETAESESSAPAEDSGGYDAQELLAAMKAAVAENETSHITMVAGGAQGMTGEGDVSYAGDTTAMQMTMQMPQLGSGSMEMRLVDGVMYLAMPPMTPKGKFFEIDTNDPNSPFGDLSSVTQGDPLATFDAFDAGLEKVVYVGEEDVDGEDMDHYVLTVDAKKAARAQGTPLPPGTKKISYDLWIDDQDLMRRMQFDEGRGGMTMTMSDWGKPVTVKAPPESAIMQIPGMAG
jgi:hypothetical protein